MIQKKPSGFATFIGMPNAGKSTLLNAIMGQKLAIVSPKIQTTRYATQAIYNDDTCQIVFIDTPGVLDAKYLMHEKMMQQLDRAITAADIRIFVFDAGDVQGSEELIRWKGSKIQHLTIVNKIDLITPKRQEELQAQLSSIGYDNFFFISAIKASTTKRILTSIKNVLPHEHPFFEDEEQVSDRNSRFFCAEFIREQLYLLLKREIPYEATAIVNDFKESPELVSIFANIVVSRESQKIIVIGEKGSKVALIGKRSRLEMEKMIGKKVYLDLRVKVRKDWRNKKHFLNEYGF